MVSTSFVKLGASMAVLFSTLAVAAPAAAAAVPATLAKRESPPACTDASFVAAAVDTHNAHRGIHSVSDVSYDSTLADYAQEQASKCVFQHSGGPYGENIYEIMPGVQGTYDSGTKDAIFAWMDEINSYDFGAPGFYENTGHATAALWKHVTKIGCAWADCGSSAIFFCEYNPPGNSGDNEQYKLNVFPKSG